MRARGSAVATATRASAYASHAPARGPPIAYGTTTTTWSALTDARTRSMFAR